ncbi:SipW-dependent-type signal peptide-containing protein (plasmid) [Haladaptatus sp. SPP-AMP-3]|uniref:SipW-dependent-type signal peptide-containing protein n=1 Tax=Haladaptatus sp. SPP-AMP-3 TaxID=3121295 RepID=UPI003C2CF63D
MSDKTFDLTRRKALLGLGGIGAGAVLGGAGTMAFLSDDERTSATFTAGKLDLKIGWEVDHYGNDVDPRVVEAQDTDNTELGMELRDVKPGDQGWIRFEILNVNNPAWVWFRGRLSHSEENGQNDPELDAEGQDTDGFGEMDENLEFRSFYDQNENATVGDGPQSGNLWNDRYIQKPLDFKGTRTTTPQYGSVPVLLDGVRDGDSPDVVGGAYPDGEPINPFENGTSQFVTVRWSLPEDVGNEIQSDSIRVCFDFYAEQSRHNPEERFRDPNDTPDDRYPENPWADEYASGAFDTLAEQDVLLGRTPDNGQPDSSA